MSGRDDHKKAARRLTKKAPLHDYSASTTPDDEAAFQRWTGEILKSCFFAQTKKVRVRCSIDSLKHLLCFLESPFTGFTKVFSLHFFLPLFLMLWTPSKLLKKENKSFTKRIFASQEKGENNCLKPSSHFVSSFFSIRLRFLS